MKKSILQLLLNYHPIWLRIGLETVYGEIIPILSPGSTPGLASHQHSNMLASLSQFLIQRFLANPDIQAEFAHPTVPHSYGPGYVCALQLQR